MAIGEKGLVGAQFELLCKAEDSKLWNVVVVSVAAPGTRVDFLRAAKAISELSAQETCGVARMDEAKGWRDHTNGRKCLHIHRSIVSLVVWLRGVRRACTRLTCRKQHA